MSRSKSKSKNIYCVNCGGKGHIVKHCIEPITSFGIIAFKIIKTHVDELFDKNKYLKELTIDIDQMQKYPYVKILMIQRKDTMGYVDFLRGKYPDESKRDEYLKIYIEEMTLTERENLISKQFEELWRDLWVNHSSKTYNEEYITAMEKYKQLNIIELLNNYKSNYTYSEFSLPKGRKNMKESNIECAEREFHEETGYNKSHYNHTTFDPIIEDFTGTNGVKYKHIYYIVKMKQDIPPPLIDEKNILQIGEVKNIGWFNVNECLSLIRPYDKEKKNIIKDIFEKINKTI